VQAVALAAGVGELPVGVVAQLVKIKMKTEKPIKDKAILGWIFLVIRKYSPLMDWNVGN
jgi:hypothetical protein